MNKEINHLYIHIPFCKSICKYCDFVRKVPTCHIEMGEYVKKIINQIEKECKNQKYETIYIGGGTPNFLSNKDLSLLLLSLSNKLKKKNEFTIECNPELINLNQVKIMKKNKINRISLGVQTLNEQLNKFLNRKHTNKDVCNAIEILRQNDINSISLDFIYGFSQMTFSDIDNIFSFIKKWNIKHVSFYSLELKKNSDLAKNLYEINEELIEKQLSYIIKGMRKMKYTRYEVSNWSLSPIYFSKHNLAYWKTNDWKGIGLGAYGLENMNYYHYINDHGKLKKISEIYSLHDYYLHILIMGLRLECGINLKVKKFNNAYNYFKNKIDPSLISIENNFLKVKNLNKIDDILESLV